jgi:hypothetical protein
MRDKQRVHSGDRSHPDLQALDALSKTLSYSGWTEDVSKVKAYHWKGTFIRDALGNMRRKQREHSGDRSHPVTRALDALSPTLSCPGSQLSYPGWQADVAEVAQCTRGSLIFYNDRMWMRALERMRERQRVHSGDRSHPNLQALDTHIKWLAAMMAAPSPSAPQAPEADGGFNESMPIAQLIEHVLARKGCALGCLGFAPGFAYPTAVIRKRFQTLALRLHPDKEPHPDAQQAFVLVRAAYERLAGGAL